MKKKKLLMHVCCAPCLVAPYEHLQSEGEYEIWGFWYNPNIHPWVENQRRLQTFRDYVDKVGLQLIEKDEYDLEGFLRQTSFREGNRCRICYHMRLRYAAIVAAKGNFDYFTSTLLYSKFQKHDLIREIGEAAGREQGVKFLYRDFREYWKEGIARSKELEMYRQQYCGCIYSEKERYAPQPAGRH
jgi:predicted adenine nucleotide alpha hydrolase (AANH) superfamily ATPase